MVSPITGQLIGDYGTWAQDLASKKAQEEAERIRRLEDAEDEANKEADDSPIAVFRRALASRGANGFAGLQKIFKILDDDNSKTLSLSEFTNAIKYTKIDMTEKDIKLLFEYFDSDKTGTISYDAFIAKVKGAMNNRRKRLVMMAYDVLDVDGTGQVDILDFAAAYDISKHPDFLQGKKSKDQILLEFMSQFEDSKTKDGVVTREDFFKF
jgi:Ca2+-binding EF-hand superfamily protein